MMIKKLMSTLVLVAFFFTATYAVFGQGGGQEIIGTGNLKITLQSTSGGMEVSSITKNGTELLKATSPLFTLYITDIPNSADESIISTGNWGNVHVTNDGSHCRIVFSNPSGGNLPAALIATASITVSGNQSQWDLSVTGLGSNHTLTDVDFPELNLRANENNAQFLVPKYSGVLVPDPGASLIDYTLYYPRGWSATMQFLAYYNDAFGVYLGFHDPKASLKYFHVKAENDSLHFQGNVVIANKTLANNNWEMPGQFELDMFDGDWFDAALIYKNWASAEAEYWPQNTPERTLRQAELGRISVWGYYQSGATTTMTAAKQSMLDYTTYFTGAPVGIHWYQWNYLDMDDDYPNYFPERSGMASVVSDIQQSGNAYIMPYINGRLYDTDLTGTWDYASRGYPYAAKKSDGTAYTQNFNGNTFAVMCPTQLAWQSIITDTAQQLTNRIGSKGIYIDQVAAAGPVECMDASHHHPLGGGHWWRDGYKEMFAAVHNAIPAGRFIAVEGGADYLANQVDGFLTDGWLTNNLVPAFQVVYSGKVQLLGKRTGTSRYHNQSFYCKLSQALVQGIEPGRTSLWIVHDSNADIAAPFVKKIATMRYKLKNFLAFGEMLRPLTLTGSIPTITSSWTDYGAPVDVTISAIQSSVYRHQSNNSVALIFANASITDTLDFSFAFNGSQYGFPGQVYVQKITETSDGTPQLTGNTFTKTVSLRNLDSAAYIITPYTYSVFLPLILKQ